MQNIGGMWLPDGDEHFACKFAANGHYHQEDLIVFAMPYVRERNLAFDIGAHVGYMTRKMLQYFTTVIAWEPVLENRECLQKNVDSGYCLVKKWALGEKLENVRLENPAPANSGAWQVGPGNLVSFSRSLDEDIGTSMSPGLVKIDTQGSERAILLGGERMFKNARPVIVVEANDKNGIDELLKSWGARKVGFSRREQIWTWGN